MNPSEETKKARETLASNGAQADLQGAIGALHDHLERIGALADPLTKYLVLRLRREDALASGRADAKASASRWQAQIDAMQRVEQQAPPAKIQEASSRPAYSNTLRVESFSRGDSLNIEALDVTFIPDGAPMGFGREARAGGAKVAFHRPGSAYAMLVMSAELAGRLGGAMQFHVAGDTMMNADESKKVADWALESLRLQAQGAAMLGASRRPRP